MGIYVEPQEESKWEWVNRVGEDITSSGLKPEEMWDKAVNEGKAILIFVNSGEFQSLAVGYCTLEIARFFFKGDSRPIAFYTVSLSELNKVCSLGVERIAEELVNERDS